MRNPAKILVTSFHPFRGRTRNASQTIAAALPSALPNATFHALSLPVTWGAVESIALPQIASLQPHILLGLGEGNPDALKVETLAHNLRSGADETQQNPADASIDPQGPAQLAARWPLPQPLPQSPGAPILLSSDAGSYLCNNALFRYSQSDATFAGFFHLPPQGETSDEGYRAQWLPAVVELLTLALRHPSQP